MAHDPELARIRWRCRRGMRELDQLLLRWVDRRWSDADERERGVFLRILECEDDTLWRWCMGLETPREKDLDEFVGSLRALPP